MQSSALAHINDLTSFRLGNEVKINLEVKAKDSRDRHSDPKRWDNTLDLDEKTRNNTFNSVRGI